MYILWQLWNTSKPAQCLNKLPNIYHYNSPLPSCVTSSLLSVCLYQYLLYMKSCLKKLELTTSNVEWKFRFLISWQLVRLSFPVQNVSWALYHFYLFISYTLRFRKKQNKMCCILRSIFMCQIFITSLKKYEQRMEAEDCRTKSGMICNKDLRNIIACQ